MENIKNQIKGGWQEAIEMMASISNDFTIIGKILIFPIICLAFPVILLITLCAKRN